MDLPRVVKRIEIWLGDELVFQYDRGEQNSWAAIYAAAGAAAAPAAPAAGSVADVAAGSAADAAAGAAADSTTPSCQ